jgi:hypothetical protein
MRQRGQSPATTSAGSGSPQRGHLDSGAEDELIPVHAVTEEKGYMRSSFPVLQFEGKLPISKQLDIQMSLENQNHRTQCAPQS